MIKVVSRRAFIQCCSLLNTPSKMNTSKENEGLNLIVFSKDRPMQLELFLESYYFYCSDPIKVKIIYNYSDKEYADKYQFILKEHMNKIELALYDQGDFEETLKSVLANNIRAYTCFFVDDIVFKEHFSFEEIFKLLKINTGKVLSLRLAPHLERSYTQQSTMKCPPFTRKGNTFYWKFSRGEFDWGYPLSVDGHFFDTYEIKNMTDVLSFKAPNSYELKLQKFRFLFKKFYGVCFENSIIVNIPCNKVQVENDNISGDVHQTVLLGKFNDFKIDFKSFSGIKNVSCHQELDFNYISRGK